MNTLRKSLFLVFLKSTDEKTLMDLESKSPESDCERLSKEITCNSSCKTLSRRKSVALQTVHYRSGDRNKYTSTNDLITFLSLSQKNNCAKLITIKNPLDVCSKTIHLLDHKLTHILNIETSICFNISESQNDTKAISAEQSDFSIINHNIAAGKKASTHVADVGSSTENKLCKKCVTANTTSTPPKKCFNLYHSFSLGTTEYRQSLKDSCQTKLIGGCRVPVCNRLKTRFKFGTWF